MKHFLRWLAKIAGSVITIALLIILFPYISRLAKMIMPDEAGSAIKTSAVIATRLENTSRLETLKVSEDGVLDYEIRAAFLGSVANLTVSYTYDASFGIDLSKVEMRVSNSEITFVLPEPELLQDSLSPKEVYSEEFWYPGFSKEDYQDVLEEERVARRAEYLSGDKRTTLMDMTQVAFERTITAWMKELNSSLMIHYEWSQTSTEN